MSKRSNVFKPNFAAMLVAAFTFVVLMLSAPWVWGSVAWAVFNLGNDPSSKFALVIDRTTFACPGDREFVSVMASAAAGAIKLAPWTGLFSGALHGAMTLATGWIAFREYALFRPK